MQMYGLTKKTKSVSIVFSYRIDTDIINNVGTTFEYGIESNRLSALNNRIPFIHPINGGWYIPIKNNGTLYAGDILGSGTTFLACAGGPRWLTSRVYRVSDKNYAVGGWPSTTWSPNDLFFGVCYGYID